MNTGEYLRITANTGEKSMTDTQQEQALYLTVEQTAERLQLGRTKVYEMIAYEGLPVVRFGRCVRINPVRLQEWLAQREEEQNQSA
jgi:excisionase family DNA binding protein